MSQSPDSFAVANGPGATVRGAINTDLLALASNNAGATAPPAPFPGMIWYNSTTGIPYIRNAANSAWTIVSTGFVRVSWSETAGALGGSTIMPFGTIPTNTQGDQYLSITMTPLQATSTLMIDVDMYVSNTISGAAVTMALFRDATVNALAATSRRTEVSSDFGNLRLRHFAPATNATATTFTVRVGGNVASTTTGNNGGVGGLVSSITVTELSA